MRGGLTSQSNSPGLSQVSTLSNLAFLSFHVSCNNSKLSTATNAGAELRTFSPTTKSTARELVTHDAQATHRLRAVSLAPCFLSCYASTKTNVLYIISFNNIVSHISLDSHKCPQRMYTWQADTHHEIYPPTYAIACQPSLPISRL